MKQLIRLALVTVTVFVMGCAHVNVAQERSFASAKPGSAVVYFYRESHFQGGALKFNIWEDAGQQIKLGALKNGSYFYIYAQPGKHKYVVNGETQGEETLDVQADKTYYVQCRIDMGFWAGRPKLTEVTENEAKKQLDDPELVMTTLEP